LDQHSNYIDVIEHIGGIIGEEPALLQTELDRLQLTVDTASPEQMKAATESAKQVYLAVAFLSGSDWNRYSKMLDDLENAYLHGRDEYPRTLTAAYNLLLHWMNSIKTHEGTNNTVSEGVAFTNIAADEDSEQETTLTTDSQTEIRDISHITCFNCGEKGHYASDCPSPRHETASQHFMAGYYDGEFQENEGVDFLFCISTGSKINKVRFTRSTKAPATDYKTALLQPTTDKRKQRAHRSALKPTVDATAHRSVPVHYASFDEYKLF
jgi:hypothetical protein